MNTAEPVLTVESERLLMRQWTQDDFAVYRDYYADAQLARFVGGQMSPDQSWRYLAAILGHWQMLGFGYFAVEEKTSGAVVGCAGLWKSPGWPELELGYWLTEAGQGKGYATEAAVRVRDHAFDTLGADTLVSYIDPENGPSRRVAERVGATMEKVIDLLDFGPHCVYRHPPGGKAG